MRRLLALAASVTLVAGCGWSGEDTAATSSGGGTIDYWLWDSGQQPGYQKCADAFAAQNPGLKVRISQYGWDVYWSKLTAGFIADTAPDVFTDHLAKFAQFADLGVLRPLDSLEATSDINDGDYQEGLAELWKGQDGKRYGSPKDWDTIAMFYDPAAVADAGIDPASLQNLTWNPQDGGTFEKTIAHLTVDKNGIRGDEAGFDKNNVQQYGFGSDGAGGAGWGQTQWSAFTGSAGWQATDKNPWGTHFNLDQPVFQQTLDWYFGLARKGYMPSFAEIGGNNPIGPDKEIQSGLAAMALDGSWKISTYTNLTDAAGTKLKIGIAPTPIGPSGKRASMFNGLADSITTLSKQPSQAAKWVKFMSGAECQNIIGESGVVFPARPSGTALAVKFNKEKRGLDVTPFTDQVQQKTTFLFPVTTNAADITALMIPRMDAVYIGDAPVSSLTSLNDQLNNLFEVAG
ncbi:ABC transporter substrate-binding protein [Paractinoplanes atraurantiacus]|uniref:Multiple sugar transport system substrate-binding protein n=1 Tax=Paractinoplanes atraurantiacus TaxID=1036182 RepID=A0A285IGL3_9ACTN|nr:sugar ABC transporter substrate-binding protein [Actinoplanes atraurantiacus]SNY46101.1 multiple sugar transport system substrate-binding protein [Actinoplanes atraurantiacus]